MVGFPDTPILVRATLAQFNYAFTGVLHLRRAVGQVGPAAFICWLWQNMGATKALDKLSLIGSGKPSGDWADEIHDKVQLGFGLGFFSHLVPSSHTLCAFLIRSFQRNQTTGRRFVIGLPPLIHFSEIHNPLDVFKVFWTLKQLRQLNLREHFLQVLPLVEDVVIEFEFIFQLALMDLF